MSEDEGGRGGWGRVSEEGGRERERERGGGGGGGDKRMREEGRERLTS